MTSPSVDFLRIFLKKNSLRGCHGNGSFGAKIDISGIDIK